MEPTSKLKSTWEHYVMVLRLAPSQWNGLLLCFRFISRSFKFHLIQSWIQVVIQVSRQNQAVALIYNRSRQLLSGMAMIIFSMGQRLESNICWFAILLTDWPWIKGIHLIWLERWCRSCCRRHRSWGRKSCIWYFNLFGRYRLARIQKGKAVEENRYAYAGHSRAVFRWY